MSSFIVRGPDRAYQHRCSCFMSFSKKPNPDDKIPVYYSYSQAEEAGWLQTSDPMLCPPGQDSCWICPECVKSL